MTDKIMTPSHVEGNLMKKSGQFKLCEELQLILDKELKAGNTSLLRRIQLLYLNRHVVRTGLRREVFLHH